MPRIKDSKSLLFFFPQAETRQLKEQLAVEKSAWEENYMKKQDTWCMQKV